MGVVVVTILLLLVVIVLVHILMLCCFVVVVLGVAAAVLSVKAAEKWTCHKIYRRRGNAPNFRWHHLAAPARIWHPDIFSKNLRPRIIFQ